MTKLIVAFTLMLLPAAAVAQNATTPDQRLSEQTIAALQALMNLRDAQIKVMMQDAQKREAAWAEYSKSLWQAPAQTSEAPTEDKK